MRTWRSRADARNVRYRRRRPGWGGAAVALRQEGFDGRVILIGAESHPPYERPPLSKDYLRSESSFEQALILPPGFYGENGIETRFGVRATRVDATEKVVELDGGDIVAYDRPLIATGGQNRHFPIPGLGDLSGVYDLRTVDDCERIRAEIAPGRKAVVGMGFIGSEVAASLRQSGVDNVVVAA